MIVLKCKNCGEEICISENSVELICPHCKNSHMEFLEKRDDKIYDNIDEKFPVFIGHEYKRFYELINSGHVTGAWAELRDVIEVIIKVPAIIILAFLIDSPMEMEGREDKRILQCITGKKMSLGDWVSILSLMRKSTLVEDNIPTLKELAEYAYNFAREYDVVTWRNEMLGHGALPFEYEDGFKSSFFRLSKGIDECLEQSLNCYGKITFQISGKDVEDFSIRATVDRKEINLNNSILEENFFCDGMDINSSKVKCINYIRGIGKLIYSRKYIELHEYFNTQSVHSKMKRNVEQQNWTLEGELLLQQLNQSVDYEDNPILMDWLTEELKQEEKGLFMLCMDRGMGKTAFVSSINSLLTDNEEDFCVTRVYYCSSLQYRSTEDFLTQMNSLFRMNYDVNKTIIAHATANLRMEDSRQDVADFLGIVLERIRRESYDETKKLLFIIDGIDEICMASRGKSIFDFIPEKSQLSEGIYILLTCRNEDSQELNPYTKKKIVDLQKKNQCKIKSFSVSDESFKKRYSKVLKKYLRKQIGKAFNELEKEWILDLCEKSEYRFIDFKIKTLLLKDKLLRGEKIEEILDSTRGVDDFFSHIQKLCGEKLYHNIGRILVIIATAYRPLSLKEISFLDTVIIDEISMEMLFILKSLDSLLVTRRLKRDGKNNETVITIANEYYREEILKRFGHELRECVKEWYEQILTDEKVFQTTERINTYDIPRIYLYAHIYQYIMETEDKKLIDRMHQLDFIKAIYQYEKYMPADQIGNIAVLDDISMSQTCITLLEENKKKHSQEFDPVLLAASYNSYLLHKVKRYKESWSATNKSEEALKEKEHLLEYNERGLYLLTHCEKLDMRGKELLAKLYSQKGVFLNYFKEDIVAIKDAFMKRYEGCIEILEQDEERGVNLYTQAAICLVDVLGTEKNVSEIQKRNTEVIRRIKELKEKYPELCIYNRRGRLDYGILLQEALFYRKMGQVYQKVDIDFFKDEIEKNFMKSLEILLYLKKAVNYQENKNIEKEQDYIDKKMCPVYNEFAIFYEKIDDIAGAKKCYKDFILLSDILYQKNKLDFVINSVNASIRYALLSEESRGDEKEVSFIKDSLRLALEWVECVLDQKEDLKRKLQEQLKKIECMDTFPVFSEFRV